MNLSYQRKAEKNIINNNLIYIKLILKDHGILFKTKLVKGIIDALQNILFSCISLTEKLLPSLLNTLQMLETLWPKIYRLKLTHYTILKVLRILYNKWIWSQQSYQLSQTQLQAMMNYQHQF